MSSEQLSFFQNTIDEHKPTYGINILVWLVLMMQTGVTVALAGINFGNSTVLIAMAIAIIQSYLVLKFFIHLKNGNAMFKIFIGVALLFLVISISLLFSNYSFL